MVQGYGRGGRHVERVEAGGHGDGHRARAGQQVGRQARPLRSDQEGGARRPRDSAQRLGAGGAEGQRLEAVGGQEGGRVLVR